MKISEIFYSIQGEGKYTGVPSIFIRTSYCNLRCSWCDTMYTSHQPENKDGTIQEILTQANKFDIKNPFIHFVLTGGEPLIQRKECLVLCDKIMELNPSAKITIETNGTVFVPVKAHLISMSPKLFTSGPEEHQTTRKMAERHERLRQQLKITEFRQNYDCQFKFVITKPSDITEILYIIDTHKITQQEVYLMPEGINRDDLLRNAEKTAQMCLTYGFNYSDRLHVRLWGEARGV